MIAPSAKGMVCNVGESSLVPFAGSMSLSQSGVVIRREDSYIGAPYCVGGMDEEK